MTASFISRGKQLKFPQFLDIQPQDLNTEDDYLSVKQGQAMAQGERFREEKEAKAYHEITESLGNSVQIPDNSSQLLVITKIKKLGAYVIAATEKSPAKYRGVFVNRMQNYCLDALENMLSANFIFQNSAENKQRREKCQSDAIIKLKMLAYVAMVAEGAGCILPRQYKQISLQAGEAINLAAAWRKSDNERWREKTKQFADENPQVREDL